LFDFSKSAAADEKNEDQWNDNYVKMPFSDYNLDANGQKQWPEIVKSLNALAKGLQTDPDSILIEVAFQLFLFLNQIIIVYYIRTILFCVFAKFAIKRFNPANKKSWDFRVLNYLFQDVSDLKHEMIFNEIHF
jgi:hypothetical protein